MTEFIDNKNRLAVHGMSGYIHSHNGGSHMPKADFSQAAEDYKRIEKAIFIH
jgi:hypothetical protein